MQVCYPQEIRQAHSKYPPHSRVSLDKTPLLLKFNDKPNLMWLRTQNWKLFYFITAIVYALVLYGAVQLYSIPFKGTKFKKKHF